MDKKLKNMVLAEAIRIGEDIYNRRKEDENGIYWETMEFVHSDKTFVWNSSGSIYSGVSGIVLFLLGLYKITKNKKYLEICKRSSGWLINYCKKNNNSSFSFLAGKMGIAYTLMKISKVSKSNYLKEEALKIAKNCDCLISSGDSAGEYMHGASGTLIVLLHLYDAYKEKWLLNKIDIYIKCLLDNAFYNYDGLHWDRSPNYIKSLCGFSHGASGIGFVLLELGKYFNNPAFYYIAEQLFGYETNFYLKEKKNWIDLRSSIYDEKSESEHRTAYMEKRFDFFSEKKTMSTWCHGAPGIGLSRLRAFELLKKQIYRKELKICSDNVIKNDYFDISSSYNLCHGLGGNLDLLIDILSVYKDNKISKYLFNMVDKMLIYHSNGKNYPSGLSFVAREVEDYSMFLGNSGIGYFYLRIVQPDIIESILAPKLQNKCSVKLKHKDYPYININLNNVKEILISKGYERTLKLLLLLNGNKTKSYHNRAVINNRENEINEFQSFVSKYIKLKKNGFKLIKDIFKLETKKLEIDSKVKSFALLNARTLFQNDIIKDILKNDELLLNSCLILNPDVRLHSIKWNWNNPLSKKSIASMESGNDEKFLLLVATVYGTKEIDITSYSYNLLHFFKNGMYVKDTIEKMLELFEAESLSNSDKIKEKTIEHIRNLLVNNLLLIK